MAVSFWRYARNKIILPSGCDSELEARPAVSVYLFFLSLSAVVSVRHDWSMSSVLHTCAHISPGPGSSKRSFLRLAVVSSSANF